MKVIAILGAAIALSVSGTHAHSSDPSRIQQGQAWLQQLVGEWDAEFTMLGQVKAPGSEVVRAEGNHWVVAETKIAMLGTPFSGRLSLGFDEAQEQFHATWIDSTGGHLWIYEASLNEARDTLTLETEGPSPTDLEKTARYREVIRITGENTRTFTSTVETEDGEWMEILATEYKRSENSEREPQGGETEVELEVQFLEIVTEDQAATCDALTKLHGVQFGEPDPSVGNARTAALEGGGRISVREPMAAHETPVVRPYVLVDDIEAAVKVAEAAGGQIAMGATEIPGQGRFAIYFLGGVQYGLWEL